MALYVSSHSKNSPNDLQMLSDAPAHRIFCLLGPVDPSSASLPEVLCVVQVALEGEISRASTQASDGTNPACTIARPRARRQAGNAVTTHAGGSTLSSSNTLVARARSVAKIGGHVYRPPDVHCCHILALLFPLVAYSASFAMLGAQI